MNDEELAAMRATAVETEKVLSGVYTMTSDKVAALAMSTAVAYTQDIPALLAEVERLRALLTSHVEALEIVRAVAESEAAFWGTLELSGQRPALFSAVNNLANVREQARALLGVARRRKGQP